MFEKCIFLYPELKNLKQYYYKKCKKNLKGNEFFDYIYLGKVEEVYCCIKEFKVNLEKKFWSKSVYKKENPLMYACRVGKLNIVKLLVEVFKMNLELLNGSKCSALTYACYF